MIELVLIVCLAIRPADCREERPGFEGPSMTSCLVQGQILVARWLMEHPFVTLNRWRCQPMVARQEGI
ncbi:hypothetical protein [Roseicella aquatilis]|uniref:Uncharacterized protein n=1 Tax=Roseicella aquatilis TaxID=2527868 RepID=A0A4R4DSY1_9PROT|nr:hypothetical protein [Roseicella aquatilis]TCZ64906.1 hypothetical protein EXY23_05915 [Roseicella aquatilis]